MSAPASCSPGNPLPRLPGVTPCLLSRLSAWLAARAPTASLGLRLREVRWPLSLLVSVVAE